MEQENISTSSRERRKVCDLHCKICDIALCFGETIARLINACFFCFHISSSQILRAALKPSSPPMLCAAQIRAELLAREQESDEDPASDSILTSSFSAANCDKCNRYFHRLEQAQDSCRKVKQRTCRLRNGSSSAQEDKQRASKGKVFQIDNLNNSYLAEIHYDAIGGLIAYFILKNKVLKPLYFACKATGERLDLVNLGGRSHV